MRFKYISLLMLLVFANDLQAAHPYTMGPSGNTLYGSNSSLSNSNFKIVEYNNVIISTDNLFISGCKLLRYGWCKYIHTPGYQKRIQRERKELDNRYGSYSSDHFMQEFSAQHGAYSIYGIGSSINPLFNKYEFYRFPAFQALLYDDIDFEYSILTVEQNIRSVSEGQLNLSGYHRGELQAIVAELATYCT